MFRRIESDAVGTQLPNEWANQFKQTLLKIYGDKCLKDDKTFEIYAFTYPEEVLLIVSYVSFDKYTAPTTLFLSTDLNNQSKPEKTLDALCDTVGVFFDHYFGSESSNDEIFDEYIHEWSEEEISGYKIFYKINRENIALSIEASKLLGEF